MVDHQEIRADLEINKGLKLSRFTDRRLLAMQQPEWYVP
jgi:hypothetical protein